MRIYIVCIFRIELCIYIYIDIILGLMDKQDKL